MMHTESVASDRSRVVAYNSDDGTTITVADLEQGEAPSLIDRQLDAQWVAAMAGAAQRDPRFAAFLLVDSPDTRRARVRRQARREARRPEIPTTTAPPSPRPRRAPRRTMLELAKEDPGAYAEYLDRGFARVQEEMWLAERRRSRPRLSRSDGGDGPRRAVLRGITSASRVALVDGAPA